MESAYVKAPNAKRFVIEDSITKVTSDGEPHEMMTIIAGLSGILAAIGILTVLIFLVACKKSSNKHECDKCSESGSCTTTQGKRSSATSDDLSDIQSKCFSTATIFEKNTMRSPSLAIIYGSGGNLQHNLNKAFESSELSLQSALERPKKQKRTHWQDEMLAAQKPQITTTTIDIERY